MTDEHIRTVEINGVKMDVDLRYAKVSTHENLKVGDHVKVLEKTYSGYDVKHGIIMGFDDFKSMPNIVVAVIETSFSNVDFKFLYFNAETKEKEMVKADPEDTPFTEKQVLDTFDRKIESKNVELKELQAKRAFFVQHFGQARVNAEPSTA